MKAQILGIIFVTTIGNAAPMPQTSVVPLSSPGTVPTRQAVDLSLQKIPVIFSNVYYNVKCKIAASAKNVGANFSYNGGIKVQYKINQTDQSSGLLPASCVISPTSPTGCDFQAVGIIRGSSPDGYIITFKNMDDTNTYSVTDCTAIPAKVPASR